MLILSCKNNTVYKPKDLRKLTEAELIERAENKILFKIENPIYKNEKGEIVPTDSIRIIRNRDNLTIDRYVDTDGEIKELVLRKRTEADKALENKLMVLVNALPAIEIITIDCDNVSKKLQEAYTLDQKMRQPGVKYDRGVDHQNMTIVASAIENCGVTEIKKLHKQDIEAIFFIVQHSDLKHMKKHYPMLKELAQDGKVNMGAIATMQDRILMLEGKLQRYGTQMTMNYVTEKLEVYSLENPEYVNKRRTEVGLGPLEDYVKQFGVEFNVKQKESESFN
jgi:hypothetical protein